MEELKRKVFGRRNSDCTVVRNREYHGSSFFADSWLAMLMSITTGSFVVAESTGQHGDVVKIFRDKYGTPVCLKVKYETDDEWGYDYISVDSVTAFEPAWNTDAISNYEGWLYDCSWHNGWRDGAEDDDEDWEDDEEE